MAGTNNQSFLGSLAPSPLTEKEFIELSQFIEGNLGIKMPQSKTTMLQSRLQGRLKLLGMRSYAQYIDYVLHSKQGADEELVHMIDVVTTNKTDFFRENEHFEFMHSNVLPPIFENGNNLKIWSAGCSTGEEPYTMAIVIEEFLRKHNLRGKNYSITASDISTRVLKKAREAIYPSESISKVDMELKKRYFLRSKASSADLVRLKPEIRRKVSFKRLNFMDASFAMPHDFDIIFCRNVIIYFDKPTQETLIGKFCTHIKSGGFLFLGHSETIMGMNLPLKTLIPTVYCRI
jgi:chemotaxis protein methyltransferase CheR